MAGHGNVSFDDADPAKRIEDLINENVILRADLAERTEIMDVLAKSVNMIHGVQQIGTVPPEEVRQLYAEIGASIEAFLQPMFKAFDENTQHKDGITASLNQPKAFGYFRQLISYDSEFRAAASNPYTELKDIWTAYIWRHLYERVFKEGAAASFYAGGNQNPAQYMRHVDQIVDIMKLADPPVFKEYVRRLWRRQALAAMFRTAELDWVQQSRQNGIQQTSLEIQRAFTEFASLIPGPLRTQLVESIVTAAVRLNEHIMIEADDVWEIKIHGLIDEKAGGFFANARDFALTGCGTRWAKMARTPVETIADRTSAQDLRGLMRPLCALAPALRFRHMDREAEGYQDSVDLVKPRVLVFLRHSAPAHVPVSEPVNLIFPLMARMNVG
ncbi:hypothetical protein KVR01_006145 [Diaporthe batatas]|uniref:uncharacterized protein n=1 Tax=Diaporthe batatas TaxID=748121 RepID=UPI001D058AD5|nr:uncharacterized protein KVR01_006145 [Diaporthe batatas]KAG8164227.1 hypothetical protein KVR01_006145 [Diaporthe batatas]